MDVKELTQELSFITGVVTDDVDYLVYLLLKDGKKSKHIEEDVVKQEEGYFNEQSIEDWFSSF